MRGSHPLPDQLPGEHTGPQSTSGTDPLFPTAFSAAIHTHSHMLTVDRSMVVGHVLTVHICSFMCTNDSTHPGLFKSWGALPSSGLPSCKQRIAGWFFFVFVFSPKLFNRNFFRNFSHGEIWTWGPSTRQASALTIWPYWRRFGSVRLYWMVFNISIQAAKI